MIKEFLNGSSPWQMLKDYGTMTAGLVIFALGYSTFLLPYQIVSGGVSGISTLIFYATGIHASLTYLVINLGLLLLAVRIMGWRYFFRTIYGILIASLFIDIFQSLLGVVGADGKEHFVRIIGEQTFLASVLGGMLEGAGLAIVFLGGGSTGGTDIIASCVNKYKNISLGRMLLLLDIFIIGSGYLLSHNIELTVIGYVTMFISTNFLDYVLNGARQSVQFIIISSEHERIAELVGEQLERGVTILYGEGWYSKEQRRVLLIMAKKYESRRLFRLIHDTDPHAFVTMSNVEGVFGEGFDVIKK
ncbi:MAG: YitT family protein [Bacteroidaceae bacterium]|nr:YitT family protein [Bacteroidaceae bacterium]